VVKNYRKPRQSIIVISGINLVLIYLTLNCVSLKFVANHLELTPMSSSQ